MSRRQAYRPTKLAWIGVAVLVSGLVAPSPVWAQTSILDRVSARGYLKFMQTNLIQNSDSILTDNLIHNRLNFRLNLSDRLTGGLEARNRLFYGEIVKSIPNYASVVTDYDGVLDLERAWVNTDALVINTIVDRLWLNYSGDDFEGRLGRQRINWGINPVWNPNDLFNAFDYLDFDYEERSGADAVRFEYYLGGMSSVDGSFKWASKSRNNVGAIRVQTNRWNYDLQIVAGRYREDWAIGGGWAGILGSAGFKGEATFFFPSGHNKMPPEQRDETSVSYTSTLEYGFRNGWNGLASYLFSSQGTSGSESLVRFLAFSPDARNLMPNRHTVLLGAARQFSPVFAMNLASMYAFGVNWIIFLPTISYSLRQNWDIDLIGQLFWGENPHGDFENQGNGIYARARWSF